MPIEVSQAQLSSLILLFLLIISVIVAIYFSVKSGDKYSSEDSERDAIGFAGEIFEADGPVTSFLIIAYVVLLIWALVYLFMYL